MICNFIQTRAVALFIVCICIAAHSQDIQYSQFFNTPLITNPALTGRMKEDIRLGLIHREQWVMVNSPYQSTSGYFDINFPKNPLNADLAGLGLVVINDKSGFNGRLSNLLIMASGAIHQNLDELKRHRLSFGVQLGINQVNINSDGLLFNSQYNTSDASRPINEFNGAIPTSELNTLNALSGTKLKANTGFYYDYLASRKLELFAGLGLFNLATPTQGRLRYNLQLGVNYRIKPKLGVSPTIYYSSQAATSNMIAGANFDYTLTQIASKTKVILYVGVWYRMNDALYPYLGLRFNNFLIGFNHDIGMSRFNDIKQAIDQDTRTSLTNVGIVGAWEISITYVGYLNRAIPGDATVPCKIF
ncbi:MAG: PorP/SprF family type IX secretion system membrane protein [Cytophagales bacterium]|nr:PorP/SprF family type IX secretion system membrane protein [Cytophagales bacterium]